MSAKSKNNEVSLVRLSKDDLPTLRDLYLRDYPKNVISHYNLKTFTEWVEKGLLKNDLEIFTIDSEWRNHGIYIIKDRIGPQLNVHLNVLSDKKQALLLKALQKLDSKPQFTFFAFPQNLHGVITQYMNGLGFNDLTKLTHLTALYYMPKEESLKLQISDKPGFIAKPLSAANIQQVNDLWPYHAPGSEEYIGRMINNNISLGLFLEENDELCAWILQSEIGFLALLHVEVQYQRRGLGEHIVALMAKRVAELKNMDATATVILTNQPSRKLFEKLGFKVIGEINWIVKPALE